MSEQRNQPTDSVGAVIDQWFRDHVQGTILARDVDVYSHVYAAIQELKQRLAAIGVK